MIYMDKYEQQIKTKQNNQKTYKNNGLKFTHTRLKPSQQIPCFGRIGAQKMIYLTIDWIW